jgi:hypothetical protein
MSGEGMQTYGGGEWAEESIEDALVPTHEQLLGILHKGMEVYDEHEHKIGKVEDISGQVPNTGEFYITVSTGFLGLGHDLYIPSNYLTVANIASSGVGDFDKDEGVATGNAQVGVGVAKEELYTMGWDKPPQWADLTKPEGKTERAEKPRSQTDETADY